MKNLFISKFAIGCVLLVMSVLDVAFGQVPNPAGPIPLVQTVPLTNAIYGRIGITNMMLLVRGDNVIGDGGGGVFAWLHGDTNTADNARYFAATNGGNWYKISYWDDGTGGGGGGGGLGTNAFVNGVLFQPIMFTNNLSSDVGRLMWYTNANGHVVGYATNVASSSSYVAAASSPPITEAYFQATTDIFYNVSGTNIQAYLVTEAVEDLIGASLAAGSNITISYDDGGTGKTTISGISSGATNGTPVNVDSGSTLVAANFTDTTGINFGVSGTNVTANLTDRNWGDITTSSSGTSIAINANSVTLGTDTTGNYIATIAGTANEVDASGSGSETAGVIVSLPTTIDLGGKTSFEVPNAAAPTVDAFGEVAGDNDAWAAGRGALLFYDGTAATRLVGVLASDTPSNGQVPKWNTGGTITWEDDNSSGGGSGGGLGTNFVLNGVLLQPATITNGLSVIWSTNANGHAVAAVSLVDTNIPSTIARLDSPTFTGTVTFDTLVANTLQFPFANSIVYSDSSSNAAPVTIGTNLTFVGGVLSGTSGGGGGSGGLGTNLFVNNILSQPAKLTNSTTIVWSTNSNGDIVATATNIAGTTTDNVWQVWGGANFIITNSASAGDIKASTLTFSGGITNATLIGSTGAGDPAIVRFDFASRNTNYFVVLEIESEVGASFAVGGLNYNTKSTNSFEIWLTAPFASDYSGGYWTRVRMMDQVSVGGSGGDVTQSGNNTFTGTNTFSGTTTFSDLAIGTITVVSNLTVPNNTYGAGWNGSTNVPNENSVYDEMELRAPKASPAFTTSATIGGTNILDYAASHLTEAEASALYQRTNAVLTATVAGTAVSVAQTNAVSFGAPTLYVGTTNVAVAVAAKAPIAGPSFTGTATNTGSFGAPTLYVGSTNVAAALASAGGSGLTNGGTIASGTITNLTTAGITMDGQTRTNWSTAFAFFQESHFSASDSFGSQFGTWPWSTIALSGGTITRMDALAGGSHHGIYRPNSGANANGGMAVRLGVNNQFLVTSNLIDEVVFRIEGTNEIFHAMGWSDAITAADPVDCLETTIGRGADYNLLEGRARSNSSETVTSDGYRVSLSTWYRRTIEVNGDATEATFRLYSGDSYPGTLLWSNTVSANLPTGSGRVLGHGTIHWKTSSGSSTALMLLDYIAVADGEGKKKKSW